MTTTGLSFAPPLVHWEHLVARLEMARDSEQAKFSVDITGLPAFWATIRLTISGWFVWIFGEKTNLNNVSQACLTMTSPPLRRGIKFNTGLAWQSARTMVRPDNARQWTENQSSSRECSRVGTHATVSRQVLSRGGGCPPIPAGSRPRKSDHSTDIVSRRPNPASAIGRRAVQVSATDL